MAIRAAAQKTIIDITDAYSVYLTCASYTFPGTTSGAKAGSCSTSVVAMRGTDQVPTSVDPSRVAAAAGVSVKASANGDGSTALSVSVSPDVKAPGKVSIPVTVDGRAEFTLEFSYGIALTGATGAKGDKGETGDDFGGAGRLDTLETLVRTSGEGVEVARKVNGNYTSTKAIVTDADYQIVSKGGDVLARYGSDKIELGKSTAVSKIDMGGDNLTFSFLRNHGVATSIDAHENNLEMSAATIRGYARGGEAVIQSSGGTSVGRSSIMLSPPYAEHTSNGNVVPYKGSRITLYAEEICLKDDSVGPGNASSVDVVAPLYVKWTKIWASGGQQVRYCVRMGICFLQFVLSPWTGEWKCPAKIPSKYAPAVSSYFGVARTQNATSSVWVGSNGDLYFYSYETATVMTGTACWPIG